MNERRFLAGDFEYRVARREDEPVVRGVLARVATGGRIQLSFRREPDAFAAGLGAISHDFVLARYLPDRGTTGEIVGVCERVVRPCFVNGEIRRLPYLAGLRVIPEFRHRLKVLRGGFEAVRHLLGEPGDLPWSLTSIMSDNAIARRLLSANLRGMPRYEPLGELSTFALAAQPRSPAAHARAGGEAHRAVAADLPALAALLMQRGREQQLAGVWNEESLQASFAAGGLRIEDFVVLRDGGRLRACAALWDQSAYRQLVVAGYSSWLARARPLVNVAARLCGLPRLPPPGGQLRAAYLSHVAIDGAARDALPDLVAAARCEAMRRDIPVVLMGWATDDAAAALLRKLPKQREFRSQLYCVRWPDVAAPTLDAKLRLAPELALL
ncbi:MAG TPA: hypothetical protein VM146_05330 [Steroidobacteraceae bacterium]|nr:hypothetical protein [Steroidobacteraceae bacterium]